MMKYCPPGRSLWESWRSCVGWAISSARRSLFDSCTISISLSYLVCTEIPLWLLLHLHLFEALAVCRRVSCRAANSLVHTSYLSQPIQPAVVYFFSSRHTFLSQRTHKGLLKFIQRKCTNKRLHWTCFCSEFEIRWTSCSCICCKQNLGKSRNWTKTESFFEKRKQPRKMEEYWCFSQFFWSRHVCFGL